MGMNISAKLIVGLPYDEMVTLLGEEVDDVCGLLEDIGADYASPYYDSSPDNWIVGVEVGKRFNSKQNLEVAIQGAYDRAVRILGVDEISLNVFCVPHVY